MPLRQSSDGLACSEAVSRSLLSSLPFLIVVDDVAGIMSLSLVEMVTMLMKKIPHLITITANTSVYIVNGPYSRRRPL